MGSFLSWFVAGWGLGTAPTRAPTVAGGAGGGTAASRLAVTGRRLAGFFILLFATAYPFIVLRHGATFLRRLTRRGYHDRKRATSDSRSNGPVSGSSWFARSSARIGADSPGR